VNDVLTFERYGLFALEGSNGLERGGGLLSNW
jgi:hypothetical protein